MAFWAMTVVIAPVVGPVLGRVYHRGIFVALDFLYQRAHRFILRIQHCHFAQRARVETTKQPIDIIGLSLLVIGVGSLQFMLEHANDLGWFESNKVIILTIFAVVGLVLLTIWEWYERNAVVICTCCAAVILLSAEFANDRVYHFLW